MIVLYLHYFNHKDDKRRKELDYCVRSNINNKNIDKIHILLENENDKKDWMENSKVILSNFGRKMKYSDIIGYVNDVENDDINIFCNLDIFFDETILKLNEHNIDNHFIALTRWNINVDTKQAVFFNNHYSQDTWIWKGKVDLNSVDLDFEYGRPGCDNAICGSFHVAGYKVINPSLDIKTYHLHQDTTRSYTDADVVRKKLYFLFPTKEWDKSLIQYWKDCTNI